MILDVKPIHASSRNCLEDILITAAVYLEYDFDLIFSESWGFNFYPAMKNSDCILGKRLEAGKNDYLNSLEKYHGLKTRWYYKKSTDEYLLIIKEELDAKRPVAVFADAFWLPWTKTYKIHHAPHYCLIVGIDENNNFLCLDPYVTKEVNCLTKNHFISGNAKCFVFEKSHPLTSIYWKEVVENACLGMLGTDLGGYNAFLYMNNFSDELNNLLNLNSEINSCPIMFLVPLFLQLLEISNGRSNFASVLKFLAGNYDAKDLVPYALKLESMSFQWSHVRKKLMSECDSEYKKKLINEAADKVRAIAKTEEEIARGLLNLC